MEITEQEFQAATLRGEEVRRRGYAVRAEYNRRQNRLVVDLDTGVTVMVPVHLIEELSDADADDLTEIEISPAGTALHWPPYRRGCLRAKPYAGNLRHQAMDGRATRCGRR